MAFSIIPLGTRGWMPRDGRETACLLVRMKGRNILLDCGTGVSRLLAPALEQELGEGPLTIIFSHYHLDHFVGITYLSALHDRLGGRLTLAGPGKGLAEFGLEEACSRLLSPPLTSSNLRRLGDPELLECGPDGLMIGGIKVVMAPQQHPGGSVTIRLGDALCYATDLSPETEQLEVANGVQCLIHEAWSLAPGQPGEVHSTLFEAMGRARRAGVKHLIPVHFGQNVLEEEILSLESLTTEDLRVWTPMEGRMITIS